MTYKLPAVVKRDEFGLPRLPDGRSLHPVIEEIAGGKVMSKACRDYGISPFVLWHWRKQDPDLDTAILTALEISAEDDVGEAWEIAKGLTPMNWQADRAKMQYLQWRAGKRFARVYGDRAPVINVGDQLTAIQFVVSDGEGQARQVPLTVALETAMAAAKGRRSQWITQPAIDGEAQVIENEGES